ncbi:dynamin family protein [Pseudescherichia sp.]|uniref:dynamin family protein n=1 Tax=Pseudescherichia sp. TaxID=2055881 RepID=UPI0028B08859|nr:dynamin family protein [Pseudescherichia sp.]
MHENNIELLNLEAQRLLDLNIDLLQEMLSRPNVLEEQQDNDKKQLFDRSRAEKRVEELKGERSKISRKEVVLAIVGTMKAGKSTTINAIVGKEILPNRDRPMTAIPTLIRHVAGKKTPELHLKHLDPIQQLLAALTKTASTPAGKKQIRAIQADEDNKHLLDIMHSSNAWCSSAHHGEKEIFEFLKNLNDLVRLATLLNAEFPFDAYSQVDNLPVIEVEFSHLTGMDASHGTLTLLDTPGPNEAGQAHLYTMMRDQLQKASAVLAVMDYTQMKSEADDKVRQEINDIADVTAGRLFILVNKFDQKNRNGSSEETVKLSVPAMMRSGVITSDRVYPGSANRAYLANRVRTVLSEADALPENEDWVNDFGEMAFGGMWEETPLDDKESFLKQADFFWKKSKFEQLLSEVVQSAHAKAAALAVDSAASKLVQNAENTHEYLSLRHQGMVADIQNLQDQINGLLSDISNIKSAQKTVNNEVNAAKKNISKETQALLESVSHKLTGELDNFFEKGKDEEERLDLASFIEPVTNGVFGKLFGSLLVPSSTKKPVFDKNNPVIQFENHGEAQAFASDIEKSVLAILQQAEQEIKPPLTDIVREIEQSFHGNAMQAVDEIAGQINDRLQDGGFSVKITFPNVENLRTSLSVTSQMGEFLEEKSFSKTRRRRSSGAWGTVCGWFGTDDWGWEEYTETVQRTVIDMNKIRSAVSKQADEHFRALNDEIEKGITQPIVTKIGEFFSEFKAKVEQLRNTLIKSKQDHESNKLVKEELTAHLLVLQQRTPELLLDSKALKADLEPMLK